MPELGQTHHIWWGHVVLQRNLDMELELATLPHAVLWTDDDMEIRQHIGIIKLDLNTRWFVFL